MGLSTHPRKNGIEGKENTHKRLVEKKSEKACWGGLTEREKRTEKGGKKRNEVNGEKLTLGRRGSGQNERCVISRKGTSGLQEARKGVEYHPRNKRLM